MANLANTNEAKNLTHDPGTWVFISDKRRIIFSHKMPLGVGICSKGYLCLIVAEIYVQVVALLFLSCVIGMLYNTLNLDL